MTAVLPPALTNPFNTTPGPPTCRLDGPFNFPGHATELDTISLSTIIHDRSCMPSPVSILSVVSAPQPRNNENASPASRAKACQLRSFSSQSPSTRKPTSTTKNFTFKPLIADWQKDEGIIEKRVIVPTNGTETPNLAATEKTHDLNSKFNSGPVTPQSLILHPREHLKETSVSKVKPLNHSHHTLHTPETGLLYRIREIRQGTAREESLDILAISAESDEILAHQQRHSDSSSGFVRSMKTASFTNASFSIFPRSSRIGRSTDSYMLNHSQPRHSADSERPLSRCSSDDAALARGLKRQQIIDELINTEEAYIADLKALVYLYSTLLASASSIPNRLRAAVEQNVTGILHLHETMLTNLHSARLRAAARRWADTVVPAKLGHGRRSRLRRSERVGRSRPTTAHRRTKSDDSTNARLPTVTQPLPAEPVDVYEILAIFREALAGFTAYEEYCANFESIGQELQKRIPQLWPTYESGIESLARAVMALDNQDDNSKRGLTVGDLLIKPIQRLTKYPLLLEQLLHNTPVADAPSTHTELEIVLQTFRDIVHMVNLARDSHYARSQIQRRWLLQDRLDMTRLGITPGQFRSLGQIELCGVLHVTYQTAVGIDGNYALCALLDEHFLVAFPYGHTGKFEAIAIIQLSDIKVEAATDGKGLQCASSFFTWKISFSCAAHYHEMILSGCSKIEQDHWVAGLRGEFSQPMHQSLDSGISVATSLAIDFKSAGIVFSSQRSLSRESSIQRAATVGGRPSISQVILRNTHNAQDLSRAPASSGSTINRSQSHMATKRIPVLAPKRSERTRMEHSISDIWTKERLPFPGMIGSRGGQIIRASAGTLARKLSLASIHTPFSKGRSSSLSMASRKSYDIFNDAKSNFEIRRREHVMVPTARLKPKDIPEVDDMRSVVGRMMGVGTPMSASYGADKQIPSGYGRSTENRKPSIKDVGPDAPAAIFYQDSARVEPRNSAKVTEDTEADQFSVMDNIAPKRRKKRWSNPIMRLREIGSEAKNMLYSSSYGS